MQLSTNVLASTSCISESQGDPLARNRLVEKTMGLVDSVALEIVRTHRPPMSREDLVSCGMRGLVRAAHSFDSTRGVQFNTYAYYRIRGAMLDGMRDGHGLSTRAEMNRMIKRAGTPRCHSDDEHPGEKRSSWPREPLQGLTVLLEDIDNARTSAADADALTPEDLVDKILIRERVRKAIAGLSARASQVLELLYYHHDKSFEAVAKGLGMTRPHIFRIHAKAVARLRRELSDLAPL